MRLADPRFTGRAGSPKRAHECRSLRHHCRVLRKGFLPPVVESVRGGIQIRMRLSAVQPIARRKKSIASWVQLLVRIHSVLFLPLIIEQDQADAGKSVVVGALTRHVLLLRLGRSEGVLSWSHQAALKVCTDFRSLPTRLR
jgi:hypothetical protein